MVNCCKFAKLKGLKMGQNNSDLNTEVNNLIEVGLHLHVQEHDFFFI